MNNVTEIVKGIIRDKDKLKKSLSIAVALFVVLGAFAVKNVSVSGSEPDEDIPLMSEETDETASESIFIDIGGAVNEPKLAELPSGSRVEDAIVAAGGLTDDADISSINRAEFLEDGEKIYIPEKLSDGDTEGSAENADMSPVDANSGKISINSADSTDLQTLSGIGPVTAQKIIDYRTANGRFRSIEDIKNVSGIGDKTYEKIKDDITI